MILSKRDIYNDSLVRIATEIVIQAKSINISEEDITSLNSFFDIVFEQVPETFGEEFKIIFPYEYHEWISLLSNEVRSNVCLKISDVKQLKAAKTMVPFLVFDLPFDELKELKSENGIALLDYNDMALWHNDTDDLSQNYSVIVYNINDYDALEKVRSAGMQYIQGNFVETSETMYIKHVPADKASVLALISKLNDPSVKINDVSKLITTDSVLSYKLLRMVNSPVFRGLNEITSIQEAVVRFGFANLKKWVMMLSLCNMLDKPISLVELTLQRAFLCQRLAEIKFPNEDIDAFYTVGLLSTLDAFIDHPLSELLKTTPLANHIKDGILKWKGPYGEILEQVVNYQRGNIEKCDDHLMSLFISTSKEVKEIISLS